MKGEYDVKIKLVIAMLISSIIIGSFTVISVYGKNDELDTTLLEEHAGGLLDYTKMYGLEKEEVKPITHNRYLRSSAPQENNYLAIMVEFPDKTELKHFYNHKFFKTIVKWSFFCQFFILSLAYVSVHWYNYLIGV